MSKGLNYTTALNVHLGNIPQGGSKGLLNAEYVPSVSTNQNQENLRVYLVRRDTTPVVPRSVKFATLANTRPKPTRQNARAHLQER